MNRSQETKISKFLSLVLRHRPETINLTLDDQGWADTDVLIAKCNQNGTPLTREALEAVVANNDKQRFMLSADGHRIRASQGHSVPVELGYVPVQPPDVLYHGTATKNLPSIRKAGLLKGQRHHVHLSSVTETATAVGARYGKPVVLTVKAGQMHADGFLFYQSDNGVWLTDAVPPEYLVNE